MRIKRFAVNVVLSLVVTGGVVALAFAVRMQPAHACSHPDGGPYPFVLEPAEGATEVPTRVEVTVLADNGCSEAVWGCGVLDPPTLLDDNDVSV